MDMWPAFINATLKSLPRVEEKIAFDKFHTDKYLGEAADKVRCQEHKALKAMRALKSASMTGSATRRT